MRRISTEGVCCSSQCLWLTRVTTATEWQTTRAGKTSWNNSESPASTSGPACWSVTCPHLLDTTDFPVIVMKLSLSPTLTQHTPQNELSSFSLIHPMHGPGFLIMLPSPTEGHSLYFCDVLATCSPYCSQASTGLSPREVPGTEGGLNLL